MKLTSYCSIGDRADTRAFVGVTELGRTVDVRLDAADGGRLTDGDVLAIDRSGMVPVAVVVRLRSAEVYLVEVDRMDPIALACMRAGRSAICTRRFSEAIRTSIPCACIRRCSLFWAACSGRRGFGLGGYP